MDFSKFNNEFMNMQTMIMKYNNQVNDIKVRIKNNSKEINRYESKIKSTKTSILFSYFNNIFLYLQIQ